MTGQRTRVRPARDFATERARLIAELLRYGVLVPLGSAAALDALGVPARDDRQAMTDGAP